MPRNMPRCAASKILDRKSSKISRKWSAPHSMVSSQTIKSALAKSSSLGMEFPRESTRRFAMRKFELLTVSIIPVNSSHCWHIYLVAVEEVWAKYGAKTPKPKLTFVVVGKRLVSLVDPLLLRKLMFLSSHHAVFFPVGRDQEYVIHHSSSPMSNISLQCRRQDGKCQGRLCGRWGYYPPRLP